MKTILLLMDFSESSINAIQYAIKLFKQESCIFYLHHVASSNTYITDDLMASSDESIYDSVLSETKEKLNKIKTQIEPLLDQQKHTLKTSIDYDTFTASITQAIETKQIDLVVMGNNGVTGAKEHIFGSNTTNVIQNIDCTTLVIPEGFKFKNISEVLIPLEREDYPFGKWFEKAMEFSNTLKAHVHILRIEPNEDPSNIEEVDIENINKIMNSKNYEYTLNLSVPIHHAINSYIQSNTIDLIVIQVEKKSFLKRLFGSSSTSKLSNNLKTPLLVYHTS